MIVGINDRNQGEFLFEYLADNIVNMLIFRYVWFLKGKGMIPQGFLITVHLINIRFGDQAQEIMVIHDGQVRNPELFHPVEGDQAAVGGLQGNDCVAD